MLKKIALLIFIFISICGLFIVFNSKDIAIDQFERLINTRGSYFDNRSIDEIDSTEILVESMHYAISGLMITGFGIVGSAITFSLIKKAK